MKISIIISIYNSHKIVVRQMRHFKNMNLPKNVEIIFVDDGSDPPLKYNNGMRNFKFLYTHDKRPWTQGLARNFGAAHATGEYPFFTDIDHIITKEAIDAVLKFNGDRMTFPRYFGIFDRRGNILSDAKTVLDFGLSKERYRRRGLSGGHHGNTYAVKREIFKQLNGYDVRFCVARFHVGGPFMSEERDFNRRYYRLGKVDTDGPKIYCYPVSKFRDDKDNNPGGLFHSLSLEQVVQGDKK